MSRENPPYSWLLSPLCFCSWNKTLKKQRIWGRLSLRTRLYQMQFSLYTRTHIFDMLMKVESCCESWLLHLDVTSLNRGKKKKKKWIYYQYFPSPCCTIRPTQPVWVHNNCTIKKKLLAGRKKKKKSTGVWMWALQLPAWREAKGNCAATNSSLIKKSQWPHWITLTHPQKLMLSLQPFHKAKKKASGCDYIN